MTLPTAFDRLVGSYYTDVAHYDALLKRIPDESGMGFHWPLVQNSGAPTWNTRGGMPCLDVLPIGADLAYFQMPSPSYVNTSFIAAIRNKGTSGGNRTVLTAGMAGDFLGEDWAATVWRGDLIGSGQQLKTAVHAATTAALAANTYNNGASGVGATLTANANGALAAQDGVTLVAGNRLLVKNEVATANNGIYDVTQVGDGATPYILTRSTDTDTSSELSGALVKVSAGTTLANRWFQLLVHITHVFGTDAVTWRDVDTEFLQYDDAGLYINNTKNAIVHSWGGSGSSPNLLLVDDAWTIVQGIWNADGWRRIRANLLAWGSTQYTAAPRRLVRGGRMRLGWSQGNAGISVAGEYCAIGEIHFVSDDLFVNQTETLDAVVTTMKTKYGIP